MKIIFKERNGARRYAGYSKIGYNSEKEDVVEASEKELNKIIPESVEGDWKTNRRKLKLDESDNIIFDESYTPPEPTSGGQ